MFTITLKQSNVKNEEDLDHSLMFPYMSVMYPIRKSGSEQLHNALMILDENIDLYLCPPLATKKKETY